MVNAELGTKLRKKKSECDLGIRVGQTGNAELGWNCNFHLKTSTALG